MFSLNVSKTALLSLLLLTSYIRFLCPQAGSVTSSQSSLKEMMCRTKLGPSPSTSFYIPAHSCPQSHEKDMMAKTPTSSLFLYSCCTQTPSSFNYACLKRHEDKGRQKRPTQYSSRVTKADTGLSY